MEAYLKDLSSRVGAAVRSTETGKIPLSFDYVLCAELPVVSVVEESRDISSAEGTVFISTSERPT
jgi:hypothetical protein